MKKGTLIEYIKSGEFKNGIFYSNIQLTKDGHHHYLFVGDRESDDEFMRGINIKPVDINHEGVNVENYYVGALLKQRGLDVQVASLI